jgi:uncharacterized protein involved in exopolysaccharide biosynthesis
MSAQITERPVEFVPPVAPVPPREPVGVWDAVRESPLLVLIPILLLVGAGVALGLIRDANYTAEARLGVIHLDVSAFSGATSAAESLADSYSRAIDADQVVRPVAARFDISPADARAQLSAAPIPDSPVFRVSASAGSGRRAVAVANAASTALLDYVVSLNRSDREAARLFRRLRAAELRFNAQEAEKERLEEAFAASESPSEAERLVVAEARAAAGVAHDRVIALRGAYNDSVGSGTSTQTLEVLVRASDATSDRWTGLELLAFIGLATGLALGVALAVARAARRRRVVAAA